MVRSTNGGRKWFWLVAVVGIAVACGGDGPLRRLTDEERDDPCDGLSLQCSEYNEMSNCVRWEPC